MPKLEKVPGSINSIGPASIGIERETHAAIKALAEKEGLPISEYMKTIVAEKTGKSPTQSMWSRFNTSPEKLENMEKSLQETRSISRMLAAMVVLSQPVAWVEEIRKPGSIMEDMLPEARREMDEIINRSLELAKTLKNKQNMPEFNLNFNQEKEGNYGNV